MHRIINGSSTSSRGYYEYSIVVCRIQRRVIIAIMRVRCVGHRRLARCLILYLYVPSVMITGCFICTYDMPPGARLHTHLHLSGRAYMFSRVVRARLVYMNTCAYSRVLHVHVRVNSPALLILYVNLLMLQYSDCAYPFLVYGGKLPVGLWLYVS